MGLWGRQRDNQSRRANGDEPEPGHGAGFKRWARYLSRVPKRKLKIKKPERYLHAGARRRLPLAA